jgi:alanyl-tRNA synthetase
VTDTQEPVPGLIVHKGRVLRGRIEGAAAVTLEVDAESRKATRRNHTATHLLHHALRAVLGDDARQAGSLVTPDRLRFDFTYFQKVSEGDLARIEGMVNGYVRANRPVAFAYKAQADAVAEGAMALFGEKYGDTVRVVAVEDVSKELCGGTHCAATGEIGLIRIVGESAIAAGVRRIEALTGEGAYAHDRAVEAALRRTAELLKATPLEVPEKVEKLVADLKRYEKELQKAGDRAAADRAGSLLDQVREIGGVKFLAARVDVASPKDLRPFAVQVRDKLGSGVLLLTAAIEGRVSLVCMVTADLTERFPAGKIIREVAPLVGGGGGGKADLAEAGGKNPDGIPAALAKFYEIAGQG